MPRGIRTIRTSPSDHRITPTWFVLLMLLGSGCAVITPRFPDDVQTAVVRDSMRRMETETLVIYYPEGRVEQARRVAARVGYCTRVLQDRAPIRDSWTDQKPRIVLADLPFNNAYVSPPLLSEPIAVLPAHNTTEVFALFNLPPDPGIIGCHEALHYVQLLQTGGVHRFFTSVFGSGYTPQIGLEPWFHEGVAVFYETKLQGGIGRLGTRYYEGILAAGVAGKRIHGGWLHYLNRQPSHGGHYLLGSFFIDWLVQNHGEAKLWDVIERQATALLPPFGVNGRFESVYGKSLSTLLDDFATNLEKRYPVRNRSSEQRVLRKLGREARYKRTRDGWEATIDHALNRPTTLTVHDPNGSQVIHRNLTDLLPGRTLIRPSPAGASGMDFSPDHRFLYFTMLDAGPVFSRSRLIRLDVEKNDLEVLHEDLRGPGGGLSPDGTEYYFARAQGDAYGIAAWSEGSGTIRWVRVPEPGVYFHGPRVSPDGRLLIAIRSDERGTRLSMLEARSGKLLGPPPAPPGPVLEASWVDDRRVVYMGESLGRMQVFVTDISEGTWQKVSEAPYLGFGPQSDGRVVRFLNREGWHWTLDEIALPLEKTVESTAASPMPSPAVMGAMIGSGATGAKLVVRVPGEAGEAGEAEPSAAFRTRTRPQLGSETVVSDEPYSQLDGLFVPQVWGPWLVVRDSYSAVLGLGALGGDRLGHHRWAVGVGVDPAEPRPSVQLDYRNALLAPLFLDTTFARYVSRERSGDSSGDSSEDSSGDLSGDIVAKETLAALSLRRSWYESSIFWGWRLNDVRRELEVGSEESRRFGGPFLGALYSASEWTPYSGVRRRISFGAVATYFPQGLSTVLFNMTDLGGSAGFVVPLPLSRLHTFRVDGRGRALWGAPDSLGLLQVGGAGGDFTGLSPDVLGEDRAGVLPPSLRFFEPLRGFEDYSRYGSRVVSGEFAYRFPFIIDQGTASSLLFMPSSFLREVAIEPFGVGATLLDGSDPAWAAGASVDIGVAFWLVPLDFRFQLSRRLSDDESWAFYFTVLGGS